MKRSITAFFCIILCLCILGCDGHGTEPTDAIIHESEDVAQTESVISNEVIILYTNDVHNAYQRNDDDGQMGYAALAAYRDQLVAEGKTVALIDGGDALQGEAVGTLTKGSYLVDIMNEAGYLLSVPGNHEFDFGMDTFLDLANSRASYDYISCNFVDIRTGETVFEPYMIVDYNGVKVAYVGISTPETFTKSTPAYFQDAQGNYIYSFAEGNNGQDLYDCVQEAIDDAKDEGAEYVICVGHVGTDPASSPWTSVEIIANTTGMSAFLDAHSHSVIESEIVADMDGNEIVLCSTGTKLTNIGQIHIDLNTGVVTSSLVSGLTEDDSAMLAFTDDIAAQFEDLLSEVVATSEVDLITNDPDTGERLVRKHETNLGDLCADAYRIVLGADIGMVNGGGIRTEIKTGDVTYGDIISMHPFGNSICMVEATGQQLLDALEMAYRYVGEGEDGTFQHVSGLTCEIDISIPSGVVVDDKGNFVKVEGERRIKNVVVNGEPIDPQKTYTVASHDYMLKNGGGGLNMFLGNNILLNEVMTDNQVIITYIQENLNGVITKEQYGEPLGQNRIVIVESETEKEE